ncbi:unnamed protein product [Adineta steineri]|uniref:Uncharacterized protein n=1 Tax=Adineta steineri TaxID=433720 RepID=A0A815EBC4_9BILA|nr:unnamed protein product [Adineta steineri]CAF1308140.1 unnamed protein product [Adineta steineri]CAF1309227.1 unnamed protein product [Adineta steineri]
MYKILVPVWAITATLYFITINGTSITASDIETGQVQLTQDQYNGLVECDKNVLEVSYDLIIKPPTNCWTSYNKFMTANIQNFKDWANRNCRNYIGCWCCPQGDLCVTFIVKFDFWHCFIIPPPILVKTILVFEPESEIAAQ